MDPVSFTTCLNKSNQSYLPSKNMCMCSILSFNKHTLNSLEDTWASFNPIQLSPQLSIDCPIGQIKGLTPQECSFHINQKSRSVDVSLLAIGLFCSQISI